MFFNFFVWKYNVNFLYFLETWPYTWKQDIFLLFFYLIFFASFRRKPCILIPDLYLYNIKIQIWYLFWYENMIWNFLHFLVVCMKIRYFFCFSIYIFLQHFGENWEFKKIKKYVLACILTFNSQFIKAIRIRTIFQKYKKIILFSFNI